MAGLCEIIERRVTEYCELQPWDLRGKSRARKIARARQIAMYLVRMHTPMTLPQIGNYFGKRDHSTVLHAIWRVIELMQKDAEFAAKVESIRQSLVGNVPPHWVLAAISITNVRVCSDITGSLSRFNPAPFSIAGAVSPPLQCAPANLRHSEAKPASHAAFYSEVRQSSHLPLAKGVQNGQPVPPIPAAYLDTRKFCGART